MTTLLPSLADRLRGLLPDGVAVGTADPRSRTVGLFDEELSTVEMARPKRRREFAAGRRAARNALAQLGQSPKPIPADAQRVPLWPSGLTGCITHDETNCLAAICSTTTAKCLGIDLEPALPLPQDARQLVCRSEEHWLSQLPASEAEIMARVVFSAKETLFKALFPTERVWFGFEDAEIQPSGRQLRAVLGRQIGGFPPGTACFLGFRADHDHILTALAV